MCLGTHGAEQNVANQEAAYTNTMISEGAQIFGQDSSVFNQLVGAYSPIVKAGPSQEGFSAAESNALNAAAIQNTAAGYRNAAAATKSGVAGFGGGNTLSTSGVGLNANVAVGEAAANQQATQLNQIQQANWSQGHQNWLQATQGLAQAPGVMNNAAMFSNQIQSGLATEMDNAQAQDARSNWWVPMATGELGNVANQGLGMASDAMQQASGSTGGPGSSGGGGLGALAGLVGSLAG